jgi:hypothetical protein
VPTIRERAKKNGTRVFHVQVRMAGYPLTHRDRWAKTVEAEMIEGKHFRSVEARRRTLGEAIDLAQSRKCQLTHAPRNIRIATISHVHCT